MAKTQWHPAFCAAMQLELKNNRRLQFKSEFNLIKWPHTNGMECAALTDNLTEERAKEVVASVYNLTGDEEKRLAEAVMQVLLSANRPVFNKIKEGIDMTLMEFMKPEVDAYA